LGTAVSSVDWSRGTAQAYFCGVLKIYAAQLTQRQKSEEKNHAGEGEETRPSVRPAHLNPGDRRLAAHLQHVRDRVVGRRNSKPALQERQRRVRGLEKYGDEHTVLD